MKTAYIPIVSKEDFAEYTSEEARVINGLKHSIHEFAQILRGEKKGTNAMNFIDEMILEAEDIKRDESR